MANQYDEDDDFDVTEDTQDTNGPANLRKALKRAEKEKKELTEQLAAIQSDLRSRSVKEVLASKGVPDKLAKFIPSDVSTPEQVDAWLTENADIFGFSKSAESCMNLHLNENVPVAVIRWPAIGATPNVAVVLFTP